MRWKPKREGVNAYFREPGLSKALSSDVVAHLSYQGQARFFHFRVATIAKRVRANSDKARVRVKRVG